jgi:hypothetical protein
MFATAAACSSAVNGGRWAEAAAPELLTLLLAVVPGSRWAEAAAPELTTLLFVFVLDVAGSKGGGLATLGGRDVGGNIFGGTDVGGDIFGGRTAGHSTGLGDAVAGSVARTAGTGGAAAAAAGSPSSSPSSMVIEPRARSESTYDSSSGSSREWAVPFFPFPLSFPLPLPLGATGVVDEDVFVDQHSDERCPAFPQL